MSVFAALLCALELHGALTGADNQTWRLVPFEVPAGTTRITVDFDYTTRDARTTIDLGITGPDGFRGWSGGNKRSFTISATDATPSYLPGQIRQGRWNLLLGIPNIRPDTRAEFSAQVRYEREGEVGGQSGLVLRAEAGWYRGDLHMHTAHSDGSCTSLKGKMVPCPVFITVEEAVQHKLDFIAITDHNTISHYDAERELQPYFDQILLIPGREITTYSGHANVFGPTEFLDFRSEAKGAPSINQVFSAAQAAGGVVSVNHPGDPTGASCIGCGWSVTDTDWSLVNGIEAVNGEDPKHYEADIRFWDQQLARGYRLVAIGGSDTHRPERGTIGHPTTVVHAQELSVNGILDAIRKGHVCIDLTASHDKVIDLQASDGATQAAMGEELTAARNNRVSLAAHVTGASGSTLRWLLDGKELPTLPPQSLSGDSVDKTATWTSDGQRHWLRAEVRTATGTLQLLSNPIFLNWAAKP